MKKAVTLTCIVLLALLCAPFPSGAADRRPRITHEFAEWLFVDCWRTSTYEILNGYDFTYKELQQLEERLKDNIDNTPYINESYSHRRQSYEARGVVKNIVEYILCEFKYDAILTAYFIEQTEVGHYDCYYWVKMSNGRKIKVFAVYHDVIFDGRMHSPQKGDKLTLYVKKDKDLPPGAWKLVKMFLTDDGKPHRTPLMERHHIGPGGITDWELRQLREKVLRNRVLLDTDLLPGKQAWPPETVPLMGDGDLWSWGKNPRLETLPGKPTWLPDSGELLY